MLPGMPLPSLAAGFSTSDADVNAYFAQMTVKPTDARKQYIDEFVKGLKADGSWAGISRMGLFASHDQQSATVDLRRPTLRVTPNAMTFTTNKGFSRVGDGSYLGTGQDWYAYGNMNSTVGGSFGFYQNGSIPTTQGNLTLIAQNDINVQNQYVPLNQTQNSWRYNSRIADDAMASFAPMTNADGSMSFIACTAPADRSTEKTFLNGVQTTSRAGDNKNFGVSTLEVRMLFITPGYTSDNTAARCPFYFHGAYLTDAQIASLNSRLNKLLTFFGGA